MGDQEAANNRRERLARLEPLACGQGVSRAATVATADIVVNEAFAALCRLPDCSVLAGAPSMSGSSIDVSRLMAPPAGK